MKDVGATYDASKNPWNPTEPGLYPAHICKLSSREVNTRQGPAIVINMDHKIAPSVDGVSQPLFEMDGYEYKKDSDGNRIPIVDKDGSQKTVSCVYMKGRVYSDKGIFLFPDDAQAGRNARYLELLKSLNLNVEEIGNGDHAVQNLMLIEEDDVVGFPTIVRLGHERYVTSDTRALPDDQQEWRTAVKVFDFNLREGDRLSANELQGDDLPF
jgi:hypothetical protein|tara:strand:- start:1196 stop:1831 length:636 start_codon:yes stop_codon:yes gene_type:complete